MDRNGQKQNKSYKKRTNLNKMDRNGQKQTKIDEQKRTETDRKGQKRTKTD